MQEDPSRSAQSLSALCEQAGRLAVGMDAYARGAAPCASARRPWLKAALAGGANLIALVVVAAQLRDEPAAADDVPAAVASLPPAAAAAPLPAVAAGPAEAVRWQGDELQVDFDAVPLPQAVAQLARATRTTVSGTQWLRSSTPVTLHLRSIEARAAWRQLLQGRARYSLSCGASGCGVWIAGELAEPSTAAAGGDRRSDAATTPEEAELEQSQPGGSC